MYNATLGLRDTYGPTALHMKSLEIAKKLLADLRTEVISISKNKIPEIGKDLKEAQSKAYETVKNISFDGAYYRKDIGNKGIKWVL